MATVALVFLIRSRIVPTRSATVADIPPILAKLATLKDGSFAVFRMDSPLSPGAVGLDSVLLGQAVARR
ncbi:MAG TPA: hypothetical protein VFQ83_05455 [Candidatus Udaeobacter sp.]|nr:hypothetical protein [Candidatus Udaeobacter sp.]